MRIVLDTNIIVSALLWFGSPRKLLQLFFNANILLFTSQPILDELRDVLSRPKLRRQISRQPLSVDQLVERYSLLAILVEPQPIPAPPRTPTTTSSSPPPSPRTPIPSSPATNRCSLSVPTRASRL